MWPSRKPVKPHCVYKGRFENPLNTEFGFVAIFAVTCAFAVFEKPSEHIVCLHVLFQNREIIGLLHGPFRAPYESMLFSWAASEIT